MKWTIIGDSQAVGLQPYLIASLGERGHTFIGGPAHVGWSTGQMLRAGAEELTATMGARPELVIVVLGGNDTPTSALAGKLRDLVGALRRSNAPRIVWVGPAHTPRADIAERKAGVAAIQRATLPALGVRWLDGTSSSADLEHTPDDLHFTAQARRTWAARLLPLILGGARPAGAGDRWLLGVALGTIFGAGLLTFISWRSMR